ncbi:transducin family protein / WD-40 repeat family protein isoform X2 [Wolffia australiana]
MVKLYHRYKPSLTFGVIASLDANISYNGSGKLLLSPALDQLGLWNVRQGVCTKYLSPSQETQKPSLSITSVASSSSTVATGHADGSIRIWDCEKGTCETTLNGHKSAVSALRYSRSGSVLASGSKDTRVIIWDLVGEAGLFSLCGHKDQVTDLVFLDSDKKLATCSKDRFLRVWDLETQHCVQIIGGHQTEVWSLDADPEENYLVAGSADPELRFYSIKQDNQANDQSSDIENNWEILKPLGEIRRQSKDRVGTLRFNQRGNLLACQAAGKTVELYHVLDEAASKHKAKRRLKRKKEKGNVADALNPTVVVSDVFKLVQVLRASKKICSIAFCPLSPTTHALATLSLSLNNNSLETYSLNIDEVKRTHVIELQGHRSDIRSVSLSSDGSLLLSTSHNAVKIWNPGNGSCLRTIESGYGLCSVFLPGNRYALIGTKSGTLEVIDIQSSCCVEVVEAHGGSVWSISLIPDGNGFVTGSADHDIKFWEYHQVQKSGGGSGHLVLTNVRTLKMNDDVLVVCVSPDSKYIAASLIDCTVRVFFLDTLKFSFPLYGHKLPVLCMDISSDGDIIVTGSADKNLKIWGLDFGDLHKSIFAHADSVTAVKFVQDTHYVFSVGKDRLVKYWNVATFELILSLDGHHAEIWCLAVSHQGDFVITGSHDRSLRCWSRSDDLFSAEEEREKRVEEMLESDLSAVEEANFGVKQGLPEEGSARSSAKVTKDTLTKTDLLIEALDIAEEELKRLEEIEEDARQGKASSFQPNPVMNGFPPSDYVLDKLSNIHPNDLEQTLLSLTFSDSLKILSYLKGWACIPSKVELVCKVATVLLQTHHNQLTATPAAKPILSALKEGIHEKVKECKDLLGFNLAAMDHLKEMMAVRSDALFQDAKVKLLEIRSQQAKRADQKTDEKVKKRKKRSASSNELLAAP